MGLRAGPILSSNPMNSAKNKVGNHEPSGGNNDQPLDSFGQTDV